MEFIQILSQIIILTTLFLLGGPILLSNNKSFLDKNFVDQLIINLVIQINFILILTFFNFSLKVITSIYFLLFLFLFFLNAKIIMRFFLSNKNYTFVLLILFFILSIDIAFSLVLDWDAQIVWFYKTLNFYNYGTIKDLTNLPVGDGYSYPHLGSLLWAFFWKISLIADEYSGRLFYVLIYLIALTSIVEKLKINFFSKIIFLVFLLNISYYYNFFGGSQDILIFCFIAFVSFYFYEIFEKKLKKLPILTLLIIPLIFNCLIWTKDEGVIYSFILLFVLTFFSKIKLNQKIFVISATILFFFIRIIIYKFYNLDLTINSCCYDYSLENILKNIFSKKTFIFFKYFLLFGFFKNYFFIFGVIFLLISFYNQGYNKKTTYIFVFYLLSFGFLFLAHISYKDSIDMDYHMKNNMHRLVFAISPFFLSIFVHYYNSLKNKI